MFRHYSFTLLSRTILRCFVRRQKLLIYTSLIIGSSNPTEHFLLTSSVSLSQALSFLGHPTDQGTDFSHIHNITDSPQHFYGVLCFYGWFLSSFPNPFEAPSNKVILTAVKLLMPFAARLSFVFVIGNPSSPVPLGQSPVIWRQNIIKHIKSTVFQLHDKTSNLQFLKSTVTTYISLLQQSVLDLSIVR